MSNLMELVADGHKASMIALYEENKGKLFAFTSILLNNKEKAEEVTANVINEAWALLGEKGITSEKKYSQVLLAGVAKQCAPAAKEEKVGKAKAVINKVYTGNVTLGLEQVQSALQKISPYQRYIYLLVNAGGMDFRELGQVLRQKDTVAKSQYESAAAALAEVLEAAGDENLQIAHVKSLLEQAMKQTKLPKTVDTSCMAKIKELAKRPTLDKKFIPPIIVIAICVVIVIALGIGEIIKIKEQDKLETLAIEYGITLLDESASYYVDMVIEDYGTVTVKLNQEEAPITAANFVTLATNGFYDGLTFHRIIEDFMMQGGDPEGNGTGGTDYNIIGEFSENGHDNDLSHTRGTISMARAEDPNSASSQFFIMHEDRTSLDGKYAAFGQVVEGMDIVDAICEAAKPTDKNGTIEAEDQPVITYMLVRKRYE